MIRFLIFVLAIQVPIGCYQAGTRKGSPYDGKGIQAAGGSGGSGGSAAGSAGGGGANGGGSNTSGTHNGGGTSGSDLHRCASLGTGYFYNARSGKCLQLVSGKSGQQICTIKNPRAKFNSVTQTCDIINQQSDKTAEQDCESIAGQQYNSLTDKCMKNNQEVPNFCATLHGAGWVLDKTLDRCVSLTSYDIQTLCQDQNNDQVCDYNPITRQYGRGRNAMDPPIDCGFDCSSSSGGSNGSGGSGGNNLAPHATLDDSQKISYTTVVRHEDVSCDPPVLAIVAGENGIQITCRSSSNEAQTVSFQAGSIAGLEQSAANTHCANSAHFVAGVVLGTPFDLQLKCSNPTEMAAKLVEVSNKLSNESDAAAIQASTTRLGAYFLANMAPYPLYNNSKSVEGSDLTSPHTMHCNKTGSVMMFQGFRIGFDASGKIASVAPYCLPPLYFMRKFEDNDH